MGEINYESSSNLLRTLRLSPRPILTRTVATSLPRNRRTRNGIDVDINNGPAQAILDVVTQCLIRSQFGWFGTTGSTITVPLRHRCPILQPICPSGGVATQLSRNRRRGAIQLTSERADAPTCWACKIAISSRSRNNKYRSDIGASDIGVIPPACRNHRVPTAHATPTSTATTT